MYVGWCSVCDHVIFLAVDVVVDYGGMYVFHVRCL